MNRTAQSSGYCVRAVSVITSDDTPTTGRSATVSGGIIENPAGVLAGQGLWAFVRVNDTGRGIPPSHIASVFEPFQQVESRDRSRGHGLGLAICRQFARRMGGDITLSSEVGVGSTFTLWLPTAPCCSR